MISKKLLELLACPACKNDVKLENEKISCLGCGRKYSIENGIPIMLIDKSEGGNDA